MLNLARKSEYDTAWDGDLRRVDAFARFSAGSYPLLPTVDPRCALGPAPTYAPLKGKRK